MGDCGCAYFDPGKFSQPRLSSSSAGNDYSQASILRKCLGVDAERIPALPWLSKCSGGGRRI
jgi:hypothetical protein